MHFVDEATIRVRSGRGGDGCCSFRREKYVPRGGPDGGDGGRGGHVILRTSHHITTLLDIGRRYLYEAEKGRAGEGKNKSGRAGNDLILELPIGTLVRNSETQELLADLDSEEAEVAIVQGGGGGRGNKYFATATHQAPREHEPGGPAEELELALELKLMADVGMLGLPNAGKSTFLSRVSAAHPRVADYPFTTLVPQLGIVELGVDRRLVVADIPGIIEGAHRGAGLGHDFLRHLERTRVLIHLVDPFERTVEQVAQDYQTIRNELMSYSEDLGNRTIITALNKSDLIPAADRAQLLRDVEAAIQTPLRFISGVTGEGIPELLEDVWSANEQR